MRRPRAADPRRQPPLLARRQHAPSRRARSGWLELACGVRKTDSAESEGCALRAASWLRAARCALGGQRTGVVWSPVAGVKGRDCSRTRRRQVRCMPRQGLTVSECRVCGRQGMTLAETVSAERQHFPTAVSALGQHVTGVVSALGQHFTGVVRPPSTIHRPWTCSTRISSSQRVGVFGGSALLPFASTVVAFFVS